METEEICNINIFPLVTTPFSVQWSPDNQISLITDKGVHILELEPSPMSPNPTIRFARSFIYPSDNLPAYAFAKEMHSLIWKLEHKEIYSSLMEEAITSKLDRVNSTVPKILKIAWSPKNLISPSRCILAIMTAAGAVELLYKISNEWYSICDVSSFRLNLVRYEIKSRLTELKGMENQYTVITENMRQLQACAMIWSELLGETAFAYFSVAYHNGDILIWKIPRISNFTSSLQPVLAGKINLNLAVKINTLCWVTISTNEHLLVIGCFNGQIYGIKLECDSDNNLKIVSTEKYVDLDRIAINYFHIICQNKSSIKIFAVKNSYLLLLCIDQTGVLKSIKHMQVQQFNITGIAPIAAEQFLIIMQNSHILLVDIQTDDLISIDVKSHLPQTHVQYLGLTQSPNKVMFINVTSPNMLYDHLVMRKPSIVHIFGLKGTQWNPLSIIDNNTNLKNVWDCIEMLRVKAAKVEDPSTVICLGTKFHSLYKQQLLMWMTVMINVCKMKKHIPNMDHIKQGKISQALSLIFVHSACVFLDDLIKRKQLSEDLIFARSLLRKYLKTYLEDEKSSDEKDEKGEHDMTVRLRAQKIFDATASCSTQIEKCNLCGEAIDEVSWNLTSCPLGHKLPRCSMTLLQITSLEYRVCPICGQIFHLCLDEIYDEPRCQFCDVPILYNVYAIDVEESELFRKNLSRSQINIKSKEQDSEESSKKRGRGKS